MRSLLALLLLLLAVAAPPVWAAEPLLLDGRGSLEQTVPRTSQALTLEFWVGVRVDADRAAYFKVLPTGQNPVYRNGTVDGRGWWTEVGLFVDGQPRMLGKTNGSALVELGTFGAEANHTVFLRVHVPPGALAHASELRLNYVVAVRNPSGEQGSGGNLNPSLLIQPRILVQASAASDAERASLAWLRPFSLGGAAAGVLFVSVLLVRRRRRPPTRAKQDLGQEAS